MDKGFEAKVYKYETNLYVQVDGQAANRLYPESKMLFMVKEFAAKAEFVPNYTDNTMGIILSMGSDRFKGKKVK